ncbi:kinase-like domain-containing protein [Trichoderma barbatum]
MSLPSTQLLANIQPQFDASREKQIETYATTAGGTTQPFTADDVWYTCQTTVPNMRNVEASAAIERREADARETAAVAGETTQLYVTNDALPLSDSYQATVPNTWSAEIEGGEEAAVAVAAVGEITQLLTNASLSVPDARIIVASSYCSETKNADSVIIRLSPTVDGKTKFGVIQGIHEVKFTITLSFKELSSRSPIELLYEIIYDPTSDNCLLTNETDTNSAGGDERRPTTILTSLTSPTNRTCLFKEGSSIMIRPGMWRISSADSGGDSDKYPLVEFLLLARQFNVLLYRAPPAKRAAHDDKTSRKRQKLNNDGAEATVSQSSNNSTAESDVIVSSDHLTYDYIREVMDKDAIPLLALADREAALIQATTTRAAAAAPKYHVRRIKYIGHTRNTSVFSCRHSKVPKEEVVVKVPQYSSKSGIHLLKSLANAWKREKTILGKLQHKNIISLKAFDGRIFSLYLELLPSSLFTGLKSTLKLSDAHKILHDIASALDYLADQRIVHNDIKPFNITYSHGRGAVLIDFGMATSIEERAGGTPWYLPPDILENGSRGLPGDVWALGITMLYVLGIIKLPERDFSGWMLGDLSKTNQNGQKMMKWLDAVASTRAALDQKNDFENIVFKMLEPKGSLRIKAADIVSGLGALDLNGAA